MAWLRRSAVAGAIALTTFGLSACGVGAGVSQARAACTYVTKALKLQHESVAKGVTAAQRASLETQALNLLLRAQGDAAAATSADGSWNPLQTTIEEANRVPLQFEVPALTRICQVANSSSPYLGA
jgi:hypothetical protein